MTKENDTNPDQIYALSIRIAKRLRRSMKDFDGDLVQAAIINRQDPFWGSLDRLAVSSFTIPFEFREIGEPRRIVVNDGKTVDEIIQQVKDPRVRTHIQGIIWDEAMSVLRSLSLPHGLQSKEVDLVFLYPTREVPDYEVLQEFKRRGWENCAPDDSLRLITCASPTVAINSSSNDRINNKNIKFINDTDPLKSLETGYGGMGNQYLRVYESGSVCYAARRKVA